MAVLLCAACDDLEDDPLGTVLTPETRAALSLPDDLPILPSLVERVRADGAIAREHADDWTGRWQASWIASGSREGPEVRARLHAEVAPVLAEALGGNGVERAVARLERGMSAARRARNEFLPPAYAGTIEEAAGLTRRARARLDAGRTEEALAAVLAGADRLRSLAPRGVATVLVGRAEEAWRRIGPDDPYTEVERTRIERLVRGARSALEEDDLSLAIRRGFYACRLLGVELP